ncbi:MAG: 3-methyl-2-oxobutanoate hydroxymethyltransferase, partial [Candidatus Omnitrophica bacterium]|nr:3-methyl-2-oxobutanoate hydroxymethyltransferase [Candidatus Omnitrophota bacterium]
RHARELAAAGADAVKIEWGDCCRAAVRAVREAGIPVMGHVGLTPQTVHLLGGFRVQGKTPQAAAKLIQQAKMMEEDGVFSLVIECVPAALAERLTREVEVPTIGIGAGPGCDGQVLVLYDLLGLYPGKRPRFVRGYEDFSRRARSAAERFCQDVSRGDFPKTAESFHSAAPPPENKEL